MGQSDAQNMASRFFRAGLPGTLRYLLTLVIPELLSNMSLAPGLKSPDASKLELRTKRILRVGNFFWVLVGALLS